MTSHPTKLHRLEPLFNPRSIAIVGASGRAGRPGHDAIALLREWSYSGAVYPVTPRYEEIAGLRCYPDLHSLPESVDLAVIAGASARIESELGAAIRSGARAALVFGNAFLAEDRDPPLLERISAMAVEAGLPLLGPYTIGYVNYRERCAASWIPARLSAGPGPVAAVMQSGSTYSYANHIDPRVRFNFTVQPGQEAVLTIGDCMDYALELPGTRVLAVYLELVRDPDTFVTALANAAERDIPVVVIRIGRTRSGAGHVLSHAGKLAGGEAGFEAVFRRYGVIAARTMDEWWTTLTLMSHERRPGPGALAGVTDSGGQRALLADLAEEIGVPWTKVSEPTTRRLRELLDPSLPAVNPVDAWAGEPDWERVFNGCLGAVLDDPGTALGVVFTEFGACDGDKIPLGLAEVCRDLASRIDKPVLAATFTARQFYPDATHRLSEWGIPVLDGAEAALKAIRHAFAYRDFHSRSSTQAPALPCARVVEHWRARLRRAEVLDESDSLRLLSEFAIPAVDSAVVGSAQEAKRAALELGFPVVLKTAEGAQHKTDYNGVRVNLEDEHAVARAYEDIRARLGARALVAQMAPAGVEVALGVVRDRDFGPLVMVGAGGILVEMLDDVRFALAPIDTAEAGAMIAELRVHRLLRGVRGAREADIAALAESLSALSALAVALRDEIAEIDINPVIVSARGCLAVDALVRASQQQHAHHDGE